MTTTGEAGQVRADSATVEDDMFEARATSARDGTAHADGKQPQIVRATDLTGVHVLKHENLFMLSSAHGDIRSDGRGLGLYDSDTRVLSRLELTVNGVAPVVLRAGPAASYQATIQLTNPDLFANRKRAVDGSEIVLRRQSLGIVRERVIADGLRERITVTNYTTEPEHAVVTLALDADFADIFELRGVVRAKRGDRLANVVDADGGRITFAYRGLDNVVRRTHVDFSEELSVVSGADGGSNGPVMLNVDRTLAAGDALTVTVDVWYAQEPNQAVMEAKELGAGAGESEDGSKPSGERALDGGDEDGDSVAEEPPRIDADKAVAMHRAWRQSSATMDTSHQLAERALERASGDLRLLVNQDV